MIRFLEAAQQELDEAVAFHEAQVSGLGQAFLAEVLTALELVQRHPTAWHPLSTNIADHRAQTNPTVSKILVQTILLGRQHPSEFLPLAGNYAQVAQRLWRQKASLQ